MVYHDVTKNIAISNMLMSMVLLNFINTVQSISHFIIIIIIIIITGKSWTGA